MRINKSLIAYTPATGAGSGTVTSVALTAPTGFTVTGSPITSSGTLALSFTTGYGIPPLMTGNAGRFLTTNGTTMSWVNIAGTDVTGAALTEVDDTNVTMTLGGTPSTALLRSVSMTLGWAGQLAVSRGGTGAATLTGVLIGNGTSAVTAVVGTAGQFLRRNTSNTAYEFRTLQGGDIAGSELTKTDDTNVTLILGGTPASALLQPVSLTLGWSGQLSVSRGGTGASTLTGVVIGNGTSAMTAVSGTAGQLLRRNAANTAYEFFTASLISGNGVADRLARWTSATNLIDSLIVDNGSNIGIGDPAPTVLVDAYKASNGIIRVRADNGGAFYVSNSLKTGTIAAFGDAGGIIGSAVNTTAMMFAGNVPLVFYVNSSERARITTSGDFGIGTNSPAHKLDVNGNVNVNGTTYSNYLQLPSANYITWGGAYGTDIPTISGTSGGGSNGFLQFYPAGSTSGVKMALLRTGQLALPSYTTSTSFSGTAVATLAVTNAGDVITIAPSQTTASGTYTPTWTGLANVGSVTAFSCQYMRVGDTVTVSGWVTIDAVADNTPTSLSFSLPINSNTTSVNYLNGTGVQQGGGAAASLSGYGANYGEFEVSPLVDTAVNYSFHFTYRII